MLTFPFRKEWLVLMDWESYCIDLFRNILFSGLNAKPTKTLKECIPILVSVVALSFTGLALYLNIYKSRKNYTINMFCNTVQINILSFEIHGNGLS